MCGLIGTTYMKFVSYKLEKLFELEIKIQINA